MITSFIKNISVLGLLLFFFASCEKEEVKIVANSNATGAVLTASKTSLTLQKKDAANKAIDFKWNRAEFGFSESLTNTLQFAVAGTNFAGTGLKEVVLPVGALSTSYTVLDFNALLLSMKLQTGVESNVEARLKTEVTGSRGLQPVYSNVIKLKVTPYALISFVYVPGAYQGWNPASADSLISPTSNGIYTGVINFPAKADEFKITPAKNWSTAYGNAGNGKVSTSAGPNLMVPSAGMYKLTIDLNENTFNVEKHSYGIIGSATAGGWNSDTEMTYNNGLQEWSITANLVPGEFKFRLNKDWGTNYGGSGGTLEKNGGNITITTTGTYRIKMSLANNTYSVVKQ